MSHAVPDVDTEPVTGSTLPRAEPGAPAETDEPPTLLDPRPVLIEVAGNPGLILFQLLRDVLAWVGTPVEQRASVFHRGAERVRRGSLARVALHPDVAVPAALIVDLVGNPVGTPPLLVTHACLRVARHLCHTGAGASALLFAQAAALASPDNPRPLLEVGRLLGPTRAEEARVCLHRAAELAAEQKEPDTGAEVHAELAALAFRRRDRRGARGHLLTAARAARPRDGAAHAPRPADAR